MGRSLLTSREIRSNLINSIDDKSCQVGVIGLGYVGLPTMMSIAESGFRVTGIDVDVDRVAQLKNGDSYIDDVSSEVIEELFKAKSISATSDYAVIRDLDVILVCVPTPITLHKEPDMGPLAAAIESLAEYIRQGQLVILQSTTYPGTTEEFVLPRLESSGRRAGNDFYLAFALERIDPGNNNFNVKNVPKVVGGVTQDCKDIAVRFLSEFISEVVPVSSPRVAEMSKLLENTFRSVNIALVNELAMLCQRMKIDVWEVIQAASTKPFGFMPFYPGPGVGGHCIPVDPFYLAWKAKEYDFYVNFIQLAAETNDNMPYYALSLITESLGQQSKSLKDSKILLLGLTFKANVNDTRNSPALTILRLLIEKEVVVAYQDNYVPHLQFEGLELTSEVLESEMYSKYDATVILTDHSYFNWNEIIGSSVLVIDLRNATQSAGQYPNVVKL